MITTGGYSVHPREVEDAVLAGDTVPETVHVVDSLPLPPVGTVLRRALREPLRAHGTRS
jgi:acyl-CoA synthetase (AMP-forming)/AMP-acid ligase II